MAVKVGLNGLNLTQTLPLQKYVITNFSCQ